MDRDTAERLRVLEAKVGELSDRLEIMQLIAAYGPAVDSMDRDGVAALWTADGSYDFGGAPLAGPAAGGGGGGGGPPPAGGGGGGGRGAPGAGGGGARGPAATRSRAWSISTRTRPMSRRDRRMH